MATVGLYGSSSSGVVASASGSESTGLYGNNVSFGGSYFEWFIFTQADTQPATPTGGSWDFTTNAGTPPTGWSAVPPSAPTNKVWVSIALVNSKNTSSLVWSVPGLFSYSSGLPILSGNGIPASGAGVSDQLYIQLDTAPQTIWFKESGTWTRLTGSSLYVDLTSNQTIAGTKTFSSTIQGSVSGTSSNVTGTVGITNGGTGSTTASGARTALGAAASGANSDITSLSGLTTPLSVFQGGTGASTASGARSNLGAAVLGANSDITSLSGITGGISTADYVQFDTTYATTLGVGQIGWDGNDTLGLGMAGGNVVQKIGEDLFYYVKASSAITKGQVVMFTGAVGASGVVTGAPATGVSDGSYIMGVAAESIALNGFGLVQFQGTLKGFDTSSFSAGAVLWYDPAVTGGLTATKPSAPNIKVQMAAVINAGSGGSGSVLIRVTSGSVLGGTDSNVLFGTLSNNDMIKYNSAAGYWQNVAGPAGAVVGTTDTQTLTNKTISGASNTLSNIPTSSLTGTLGIANGGTGQTTAAAAITALTGTQTNAYYLRSNGTNASLSALSAADLTGTVSIASGGTGQTTANAAFNALAPSQTGNSGKYLTTDGTNTSWATNPLGTVTSVGGTGTVSGITLSGTVTTSGNLTLGGALDLSSPPAIGGTTPNSGAFTTLSASGNVTLSGGTANGVPYLNASKVLTSGSALTFDGTALTNASTGNAELALNTAATPILSLVGGTGTIPLIGYKDIGLRFGSVTGVNGAGFSEQMRLTSTGLGIGTSSPGGRLDVKAPTGNGNIAIITGSTTADSIRLNAGGSTTNWLEYRGYLGHAWFNNAGQQMMLDTSGNLGLGVTPSASVYKTFEQTGIAITGIGSQDGRVYGNAYEAAGGAIYKTTGQATLYRFGTGTHYWYVAPSGTAGNAITFTQAMTLDASGNLGVGLTPVSNIRCAIKAATDGADVLRIQDASAVQQLDIGVNSGNGGPYIFVDSNHALRFGTNSTERARIDSSGNLLVGTTSTGVASGGVAVLPSAGQTYISIGHISGTSSGSYYLPFIYNGSVIGGVTQNGTTGVLYNLTSDYRLKNNPVPVTGAKEFINALQPKTWDWWDGSGKGVGFIAHEFMEVAKYSGNGTKDAVDDDGNPVYQSIQPSSSEVMANLVAYVQELRAEFDAYKAAHP